MPTGLIIGLAVAGIGLSGASAYQQSKAAEKQSEAQQQMIAEQQKQEAIRQRAMELDAQRKQTENLRQVQRARALAVSTATNQGANLGSGLQGGLAQVSGQGNWNALGIQQGLGFGQEMFASNAALSQDKIAYAQAQGDAATWAGLGSLGGTLISSASTLGNIGGNLFGRSGGGFGGFGGGSAYNPGRIGSLY